MTREDAIICLKGIKNYGRDTFNEQSDWQGCLDMAIEALEQEPVLDKIRAEIITDKKKWWYGVNNDCFMKLSDVLSIIDKYRITEEE